MRPAARHGPADHRAAGAADPDAGVDVHKDDRHRHDRRHGMGEQRHTLLLDRRIATEILVPDHESAGEHHCDQRCLGPEHRLLPGIVLADLRQPVMPVAHDVAQPQHPLHVIPVRQVQLPEPDEQHREAQRQYYAKPRMHRSQRSTATEQRRQQDVEIGREQRQPAHPEQGEQPGGEPVVDPLHAGVAVDVDFRLGNGRLQFGRAHGLAPFASAAASCSSAFGTSSAPAVMKWKKPPTVASARVARPNTLKPPFQNSTRREIRGLFGRLA